MSWGCLAIGDAQLVQLGGSPSVVVVAAVVLVIQNTAEHVPPAHPEIALQLYRPRQTNQKVLGLD